MPVDTEPVADVKQVLAALGPLPPPRGRPALVIVSGLPGTGKSLFCRELRRRAGVAILESDALRKLLFPQPTYSGEESQRLFTAVHAAIERLLASGVSCALDATNLKERHREPLYAIAEKQGAKLILVEVTAPPEVVRRRLESRTQDGAARSDADIAVYERMRREREEIPQEHYLVDTTVDMGPVLAAIGRDLAATQGGVS